MQQLSKFILLFMLILIAIPSPVVAIDGSGDSKSKSSFEDGIVSDTSDFSNDTENISIFGLIIQIILALLFVGVLIFLFIKFLSMKNRFTSFNQPIKLVGTMAFTPQKSVRVVELGNSLYFIGVGEDITLLQKIDDQEEIELIKATIESSSAANFSNVLKSKMTEIMSKRQNIEHYFNKNDRDGNEGKGQ